MQLHFGNSTIGALLTLILSKHMDFDEAILGNRIKQARDKKGLSQTELAKALGIGQRGISELENGKRKLAVSELPVLAKTLDVPILYFLEGTMLEEGELEGLLLLYFNEIRKDELKKSVIDIARILSQTSS